MFSSLKLQSDIVIPNSGRIFSSWLFGTAEERARFELLPSEEVVKRMKQRRESGIGLDRLAEHREDYNRFYDGVMLPFLNAGRVDVALRPSNPQN